MSGHSWILPSDLYGLFFDIKRIAPIKLPDDEIVEMPGNYMMYGTRRGALEDLISEIEDLNLVDIFKDIYGEKALQWKDKKSLRQYAMSRLAIVIGPPIIMVALPFMKFRIYQLKRYVNKEHPEWLI